ncbi:major centromere autoantigen B-like [Ixodes scapularis]
MSVPTASSSSCPPKFEKLEEAVNIWFAEMRSRGAAVSDEMLQEKAKEFGTTMGILVNSSAMEVEDPMDELPLAALREALRQLGEKNPDEEASAFLDIDEETNSWEPMSDEQIMELVGESAQQGHQLVENFAPTETDDEEERPTVTRCEARRGLETAIAYLEQEGDGERALQVAEVLRFSDTKVGSKAHRAAITYRSDRQSVTSCGLYRLWGLTSYGLPARAVAAPGSANAMPTTMIPLGASVGSDDRRTTAAILPRPEVSLRSAAPGRRWLRKLPAASAMTHIRQVPPSHSACPPSPPPSHVVGDGREQGEHDA